MTIRTGSYPARELTLRYGIKRGLVYCLGEPKSSIQVPVGYERRIANALDAAASNGWYLALCAAATWADKHRSKEERDSRHSI